MKAYKNSDGKNTTNIEDKKSVDNTLKHAGHNSTGVLGFSGGHGEVVRATIREGSCNESRPDTEEFAETPFSNVLDERSRIFPVSETKSVVLRVSSSHRND